MLNIYTISLRQFLISRIIILFVSYMQEIEKNLLNLLTDYLIFYGMYFVATSPEKCLGS